MKKDYFAHAQALVESPHVGEGTRIWAFAHVLPKARIGKDCNICDGVFIENDVTVGDRVTVKCGVQLWDGITLEDDVFVGPNATFTNDKHPRSRAYPEKFSRTLVQKGASIGANATLLPGITVQQGAMVGAGAVVTKDVPAFSIVVGNPAKIVGYVETKEVAPVTGAEAALAREESKPDPSFKARILEFKSAVDARGSLSVGEAEKEVPFPIRRVFMVYDVPSSKVRGEHAHKKCEQVLIAVKGSLDVLVDDGERRKVFRLDCPTKALYLPALHYGVQFNHSPDCVLLVLASHSYESGDYIRGHAEFLRIANG